MPRLESSAGSASIQVDPDHGGRLASLIVDGHELLVGGQRDDAMRWGSYPMVPFAGRIRDGCFRYDGVDVQLPLNAPPHAIHGVGFTSMWEQLDRDTIRCHLDKPWPFGGVATQRFSLDPAGVTTTMTVKAEADMPLMVGWHPWFNRDLTDTDGNPVQAQLRFGSPPMYELDEVGIPTGTLVEPPDGPWDNCFTDLVTAPVLSWPGLIDLELTSSCDHWVIYDEPEHALCVEPQSAAPDVFNRNPTVLNAGEELAAWYRIAWG